MPFSAKNVIYIRKIMRKVRPSQAITDQTLHFRSSINPTLVIALWPVVGIWIFWISKQLKCHIIDSKRITGTLQENSAAWKFCSFAIEVKKSGEIKMPWKTPPQPRSKKVETKRVFIRRYIPKTLCFLAKNKIKTKIKILG